MTQPLTKEYLEGLQAGLDAGGKLPYEAALELLKELLRLRTRIDTPELINFVDGVHAEAVHQWERWGEQHDQEKSPEDWVWLIAHLVTKAAMAGRYGDAEKQLHHTITAAAALASWHRSTLGRMGR